jgi:hypothetical protein
MIKRSVIGLAVLAAVSLATFATPSTAEAYHGTYYRPHVYPAYRSYYYSAPVVYTTPVYYSAPVVYSPAPVVYSRPVYYSRPYYYGPSSFSFGYYGGGHHRGHGGVSVRVGY